MHSALNIKERMPSHLLTRALLSCKRIDQRLVCNVRQRMQLQVLASAPMYQYFIRLCPAFSFMERMK